MRILGIDHGDVRIGLALSDEGGLIARPLHIIRHVSKATDAETIARIAKEKEAKKIVIGLPTDEEGGIGHQARKVQRWAEALQTATDLPIEFGMNLFRRRMPTKLPHAANAGKPATTARRR
jgi:putative Holliday junction resolvase